MSEFVRVIDWKRLRTGEQLRVVSGDAWVVKWHSGDASYLTKTDRREQFEGADRYEVISQKSAK